jgi:hypothetical protein
MFRVNAAGTLNIRICYSYFTANRMDSTEKLEYMFFFPSLKNHKYYSLGYNFTQCEIFESVGWGFESLRVHNIYRGTYPKKPLHRDKDLLKLAGLYFCEQI